MAVVVACMLIGLAHVWQVSYRYFVGSFDDDSGYILAGRALLHGDWLTAKLPSGDSLVAGYPPGFPLLLVPLLWLFPHTFEPLRLLSIAAYAAVFPLTWYYLRRRQYPFSVRAATLLFLALNVVLATFASMVMAETPFLVCLLVYLIAVDMWEKRGYPLGGLALLVVLLGAEAVWLKEAGVGLALGLGAWLLLKRKWWQAVAVVGGLVALLVPVVVARLADGVPLAGGRYTQELGSYYKGGLVHRVLHSLPGQVETWVDMAFPRTVAPLGGPLAQPAGWHDLSFALSMTAALFFFIGLLAILLRKRLSVEIAMVGAYLVETLFWPQMNERRVILVVPIVLAWYAYGLRETYLQVARVARRGVAAVTWRSLGIIFCVAAVIYPCTVQFGRDYLFPPHVDTSRPQGSRYMEILNALYPKSSPVEVDYRYTTALFSGHVTKDSAINNNLTHCTVKGVLEGIHADKPGFLLWAYLNKSYALYPCIEHVAASEPWSVRLLRTKRDHASVFELIGPGTAHPNLINLLSSASVQTSGTLTRVYQPYNNPEDVPGHDVETPLVGGKATFTWPLNGTQKLTQLSVGEAGADTGGSTTGVLLQVESSAGTWMTVASADRAVGEGAGLAPFLLKQFSSPVEAKALRIVVEGSGEAAVLDVSALGLRS